jgi:hypothetical protein
MKANGQVHNSVVYPREKSPWYWLDRGLGGPQGRSERGDKEETPCPC